MANEKNLKNFKKGGDSRRWATGRPKKWTTQLKEQGYANAEVVDAIAVLVSMKKDELEKVHKDENATILERIVSGALLKSYSFKSLFNIETLFSRAYGKPRETVDASLTGEVTITMNLTPDEH